MKHFFWARDWFKIGTVNAFATGIVAVATLPLGTNSITLVVSDGLATGAQTIAVEVITPRQAIERLKAQVLAQARPGHPLAVTLSAAIAATERGNRTAAINQLQAFQHKVRAQLAPTDPALATQLILAAQEVIDSLSGGSGREHVQLTAIHRQANGKTRLHFNAQRGPVYIIEVSTNLVDWEKMGVAADDGNGLFEFEDANATRTPTRFYRIVSP